MFLSMQVAIIPLKKGLPCVQDQCWVDDIFKDQDSLRPHATRRLFKGRVAERASVPFCFRWRDSHNHGHSLFARAATVAVRNLTGICAALSPARRRYLIKRRGQSARAAEVNRSCLVIREELSLCTMNWEDSWWLKEGLPELYGRSNIAGEYFSTNAV
jgi:hypothetical protein